MKEQCRTKLVRVGKYLAEVEVKLILTDDDWSPYLSVQDACKLDEVRKALEREDLESAQQSARVFFLTPVAV
ncbi:MAG: hypothetical protein V1792_28420 [Pseudomonadota bacterium]